MTGARGPVNVVLGGGRPLLLLDEDVEALIGAIRRMKAGIARSMSPENAMVQRLDRLAVELDSAADTAGSPPVVLEPQERRLVAWLLDDMSSYQRLEPTPGLQILRRLLDD